MHYGVNLGDIQGLWQQALREPDGSPNPRSQDDGKERQFWQEFLGEKQEWEPDAYSVPIAHALEGLMEHQNPDTILELGPGWGNYTFTLAPLCRELTCIDISPDVLDYLQRIGKKKEITNLKTICSKWEDAELPQKYSAVYAFNCFYRMQDLAKCLQKIDDSADFHVVGMTSGPDQPFLMDFSRELKVPIKWHRFDYIYFTNMLYKMGIDVNCKIVPVVRTYRYASEEEAYRKETKRILAPDFDREKAVQILRRYLVEDELGLCFRHHFRAALLYW